MEPLRKGIEVDPSYQKGLAHPWVPDGKELLISDGTRDD
jgi:hypothetical protein